MLKPKTYHYKSAVNKPQKTGITIGVAEMSLLTHNGTTHSQKHYFIRYDVFVGQNATSVHAKDAKVYMPTKR